MLQVLTMNELIEWAWQSRNSLMRKHKFISSEKIALTAHIGLERLLMERAYNPSNLAVFTDNSGEFRVSGLRVIFSDDYDNYTCSVSVPDWRPCVDARGNLHERPETFTVDIKALI